MKTIHAKFKDGVFTPAEPVELPDNCDVEFEPRVIVPRQDAAALDAIYEVLGRRYESGITDTAERHNEHQP